MATVRANYPLLPKDKDGNRARSTKQDGWLLRWKDHHRKWRSKTFKGSRIQSEKALNALLVKVDGINANLIQLPEKTIELDTALQMYAKYLKGERRSLGTIERYAYSFLAFKNHIPGNTQIQLITREDIDRFKDARAKDCRPNTVAIDLRHLRAFFNWCYERQYLTRSPLAGVKIKAKLKDVRMLSRDELNALYEVTEADKDAYDLVRFYISSGARAREILPPLFTWENVHQNEITFWGKGDKVRKVALNDTMKEILESRKHLPFPFPFKYAVVANKIVNKYFPMAGIKDATLHNLRKTSGGILIQKGVDVYRVSKFLGHSSVTTTEKHYIDITRDAYQDMAELLNDCLESDQHIENTDQHISTHSSESEQVQTRAELDAKNSVLSSSAGEGNRTPTSRRKLDFESSTPPHINSYIYNYIEDTSKSDIHIEDKNQQKKGI